MTSPSPNLEERAHEAAQQPAYGFGATIDVPFDAAVARLTEELKAEGFGVLTTIDVQQTLKEKLGIDFERYLILGVCNPQLAYRALEAEHEVGLVLPCNVVVHEAHEPGGERSAQRTRIDIADPIVMLGIVPPSDVQRVACDARNRLQRVADRLNP